MIWSKQVLRVDGELKAYVRVQNEFTGSIQGRLYTIKESGNVFYVNADGERQDVTHEREAFLNNEAYIKRAVKFFETNGGLLR